MNHESQSIGPTWSLTDMLPIRFVVSRRFCKTSLLGLAVFLLLGSGIPSPLQAGPLPPLSVDDFRTLIDPKRAPIPDPTVAGPTLAEYRRRLRQASLDLPSLGQVSRVLLMSEWSSVEFEVEPSVPLDQVRKAVGQAGDEAFKRDVQKLMADHPDDRASINQALVNEIKREVRFQLLERLENRMRFYLNQGRVVDRIATANLIGDTVATSRRQDISQYRDPTVGVIVPGVMAASSKDVSPSSHYLRQRLRGALSGDLEKLIADPNSQVRVAGIRALSDLEKEPAEIVALLKPLLAAHQDDAPTREAAAEAMGHVLEVYAPLSQMDKSRPDHYLMAVELVLPAAAGGLADSDARVRRASLEACQQAALVLESLADDPLASDRRVVFRPALVSIDRVLPKINECARDRVPELRIGACRVLETLALAVQKLQRYRGGAMPAAMPEPIDPLPHPANEGDKSKKQSSQPSRRTMVVHFYQAPAQTREDSGRSRNSATLCSRGGMLDELPPPALVGNAGIEGGVQTMIANLKHPDYRVRLAAVDTLETYGKLAEAAIPSLVTALRDYNKFVRWSSARTLGRMSPQRPDEVVPGLMRLLDDREDPSVRIAAAKALELYGEHARQAVPLLARVINRGDKTYILAILTTIQGIGTDAAPALPNVAWVLSDRTQPPSVRIEAAQTLGRFGALAKNQLSALRDVMNNDPDEDVRNAASIAVLAVDRPLK